MPEINEQYDIIDDNIELKKPIRLTKIIYRYICKKCNYVIDRDTSLHIVYCPNCYPEMLKEK